MANFEIHGDDENGVTVRLGNREQIYILVHWSDDYGPFVSCKVDGHPVPMPDMYRLVLDMCERPDPLNATPTVYGEGVWLH